MPDAAPKFVKSKRRSSTAKPKQSAAEQAVYGDIEKMVRQRAYYLWEHEDRPQGRELEHWQRARQEIQRELQHSVSTC